MAQEKDDNGSILLFLVLIVAFVAAVVSIGLFFSKLIYRFSRSAILSIIFFLVYISFFVVLFYFADGEGDTARDGWQVLQHDFLMGIHPGVIFAIFTIGCLLYAAIAYRRLSDEMKEIVWQEVELERENKSNHSFATKLMLGAGAGYLGYKAGRKAGRGLM